MQNEQNGVKPYAWVQGEITLAGLDNRMINLLRAINDTGSINRAAKQVGLSYKGAWQIIERANNLSPKVLITTATGGSKGGGTSLTPAGRGLLELFTRLEEQHRQFLQQLNRNLGQDAEMSWLLKPLALKTSMINQLYGIVESIRPGAINAEVLVVLKGDEKIRISLALSELDSLAVAKGSHVLLLINSAEISIMTEPMADGSLTGNRLTGKVMRIHGDGVDCEVVSRLNGHGSLVATITQVSAETLRLKPGMSVDYLFNGNAVILAAPG